MQKWALHFIFLIFFSQNRKKSSFFNYHPIFFFERSWAAALHGLQILFWNVTWNVLYLMLFRFCVYKCMTCIVWSMKPSFRGATFLFLWNRSWFLYETRVQFMWIFLVFFFLIPLHHELKKIENFAPTFWGLVSKIILC